MKLESADKPNGSADTVSPTVLKIDNGEEFRQSLAVAELAVRLCQLKIANPKTAPIQKENLDPKEFLEQAWKLIQGARQQVLRPQTDAEYLAERGGSHEAAENVVARILSASRVPFTKLCDSERNRGDTETIHRGIWKVFTTDRGFEDLFYAYWHNIGEKWKNPKQAEEQGKLRVDGNSVPMFSKQERQQVAKLARDADAWKQRGKQKLAEWKRGGVPANDFLALRRFRAERDNRSKNLKKTENTSVSV